MSATMSLSLAGVIVCTGLLLLGIYLRGPLIIALFASFAFGSTAIATLGFLGNSSPLIFVVFSFFLLASVLLRHHFLHELSLVLSRSWVPWVVALLPVYAAAGAFILPRLFAGQTTAFVPTREAGGGVFELPLAPVSGNVTQTAYLTLGALIFFAVSVLLVHRKNLELIRRGYFTFCAVVAVMGLVDAMAKFLGAGDTFSLIRSASYTLHTDSTEAGFSRITGGYSEASAFGAAALAATAFTFTYWRRTGSPLARTLSFILASLVILSTSTTAYVGAAIVAIPTAFALVRSVLKTRLAPSDLTLFAFAIVCIMIVLSIYLYDTETFTPFVRLFEATVLDKPLSSSAHERAQWNLRSVKSLFDSAGLGIGLGSSRASSWVIAVLSQLGLVGTLIISLLVFELVKRVREPKLLAGQTELIALHDSARAFTLATLVAAAISGGAADPGVLFFISLATVLACRERLSLLSMTPFAMTHPRNA